MNFFVTSALRSRPTVLCGKAGCRQWRQNTTKILICKYSLSEKEKGQHTLARRRQMKRMRFHNMLYAPGPTLGRTHSGCRQPMKNNTLILFCKPHELAFPRKEKGPTQVGPDRRQMRERARLRFPTQPLPLGWHDSRLVAASGETIS